jgi:hypothetical protein
MTNFKDSTMKLATLIAFAFIFLLLVASIPKGHGQEIRTDAAKANAPIWLGTLGHCNKDGCEVLTLPIRLPLALCIAEGETLRAFLASDESRRKNTGQAGEIKHVCLDPEGVPAPESVWDYKYDYRNPA